MIAKKLNEPPSVLYCPYLLLCMYVCVSVCVCLAIVRYRGRDSRSNAAYAGAEEGGSGSGNRAVFTAAGAGVSLDLTNYTQVRRGSTFFSGIDRSAGRRMLHTTRDECASFPVLLLPALSFISFLVTVQGR